MTTLNKAMCGKLSEAPGTRSVKIPEIETIRREGLEPELAWLAGFIDGEGNVNVGFYGNGQEGYSVFRIGVCVVNTSPEPIRKATEILHRLGVFFKVYLRKRHPEKWSPCFALEINGQRNAYKFIKVVLPYLTCKKEIAQQAIFACEYRWTLTRAGNNQYTKNPMDRVQDDPILHAMAHRAMELVHYRPDPTAYSMKASEPLRLKKPSETSRLTALSAEQVRLMLNADDKVRSA